MFSYLILFKGNMLDFENSSIKQWLQKISLDGQLLSIDELNRTEQPKDYPLKGFALINARSNEEVYILLKNCPGLDIGNVMIYKVEE